MVNFVGEQEASFENNNDRVPDTIITESDALTLDLDDEQLIRVIDDKINQAETFFNEKKHLKERRERNKNYLFGNQINEDKLKYYNARYVDNLIYEAEGTIKPIALSRLPDLLVKPAKDSEESKEQAKNTTKIINSDIRKRTNRKVLALGFKHHPVYFTGVLKAIWDPEQEDYKFKVIHPNNIVVDHTSATNNAEDMELIAEATEKSVKEIVMSFPNKEQELYAELSYTKEDTKNDKKMSSKIKI